MESIWIERICGMNFGKNGRVYITLIINQDVVRLVLILLLCEYD